MGDILYLSRDDMVKSYFEKIEVDIPLYMKYVDNTL